MYNDDVAQIIKQIVGKKCCRKKVGEFKSLSLGFGIKVFHHNPRLNNDYYGEWEVGSYFTTWRVIRDDRIICASRDPVDRDELDAVVKNIELGNLLSIGEVSNIDVRLYFDSSIMIDFLATISDEEEGYFHIFGPENLYVELSKGGVWTIGKSNEPLGI
jgi:hypothetical protein